MKEYEIRPMNIVEGDFDTDFNNTETYDTYKEAVQRAKALSLDYARVDIDLYQLNRAGYDEQDYQDKWYFERPACLRWTRSFENGKQVPVYYQGGHPVWQDNAL